MSSKTQVIDGLGEVSFTRRKSSKRISLRVKSDGVVSVNYPWFATQKEVLSFVAKNKDWILAQKQRVESHKATFELNQTIKTHSYTIEIVEIEKGNLRAVLKNKKAVITVPSHLPVSSEKVQLFVRKVIIEVCRKEARLYLPQRVAELAALHGFSYENVYLKNLKSKWGSCSSLGNINLNVHLMRLPDHLIDYIILHELTHTVEMNHGPKFWLLLDKVTGGKAKLLNRQMKAQGKLILK